MKFIYTAVNDMAKSITKYDISFDDGKEVEVSNLAIADKLKKNTLFSICVETVNTDLEDARAKYEALSGNKPNMLKKLATILKDIEGLENEQNKD